MLRIILSYITVKYHNISYVISDHKESQQLLSKLDVDIVAPNSQSDIIIVLGGDGSLLHTIHKYMHLQIPFYGINSGTVGFLMNRWKRKNLYQRIEDAIITTLHPLRLHAIDINGQHFDSLAVNEVSIYRNSNHVAKFTIKIDGQERIALASDGALVSTPAGSSAYNFSAGGRIIPLGASLLSVTPICPFRPRRWHGALVPSDSTIEFIMEDTSLGKVNAVADFHEFHNIAQVKVKEDSNTSIELLFDNDYSLEERIIKEQFLC